MLSDGQDLPCLPCSPCRNIGVVSKSNKYQVNSDFATALATTRHRLYSIKMLLKMLSDYFNNSIFRSRVYLTFDERYTVQSNRETRGIVGV